MSQHGRIILGKKSVAIIKRNPNGRIPAVLAVFGIMLGIANLIELIDMQFASPVPLIIMIALLYTIDESILHSEIKPVRQILLLLALIGIIRVALSIFSKDIFMLMLDCPILLYRGVLFIRIASMFRRNPFLIRNENWAKIIFILNFITGILFLAAGIGDLGAFLGLVPPIPVINIIARLSGCAAGLMIAVSCSFSNRVFLKQLRKLTQLKKRVKYNK